MFSIANLYYAKISFLHPWDYFDDIVPVQDMEATLVHELLHLPFDPVSVDREKDPAVHILFESAIDRTSLALIALDRQARGVADLTYYREPVVS